MEIPTSAPSVDRDELEGRSLNSIFRSAATALAGISALALLGLGMAALIIFENADLRAGSLANDAIALVFLVVGVLAFRRARMVPAGPAFLIHACSWTLYLAAFPPIEGRPEGSLIYLLFALGAFLHAPSLLHFAAALAFPRHIGRWLRPIALFYAAALLGWLLSVAGAFAGWDALPAVLDGLVRDKVLDFVAFFGALGLFGAGLQRARSERARHQLGWALGGIALGMGPGWLSAVPGTVGRALSTQLLPELTVYSLFFVIMPLAFAYAIVRYNLFDMGRLHARAQQVSLELLLSTNVREVSERAVGALHEDFELRTASLWTLDDAGLPVRIGGAEDDDKAARVEQVLKHGEAETATLDGRSVLVYPLHYGDRVEAALAVERSSAEPFEQGHWEYLRRLEPQLAVALHLRRVDDRVRIAVEELRAFSQEVDTIAAEVRTAGESVSAATQEVSENSMRQHEEFRQVAETIVQLRNASEDIANRLASADRSGEATLGRSRDAARDVEVLLTRVKSGARRLGGLTDDVTTLRTRSTEISSISSTIREVAEQTNLLALNAAIEAARAGEHGRGFAVVADEVRKLAENSAGAAGRIGQIVNEVLGDIARVAEGISGAEAEIAEGARSADRVGSALGESLDQVDQLRSQISGVAALMESARERNESINAMVHSAADISAQNAAAAEETAATTEEQLASMESMASGVRELSHLGNRLFELLETNRSEAPRSPAREAAHS